MHCEKYLAGECLSCQWLELSPEQQISRKQNHLQSLLPSLDSSLFLTPITGPAEAFRNKAKMVVSGSVEKPILGIVNRDGVAVSLTECPLYPAELSQVFAKLIPFIARAGLTPYNIERKRGELKYILLTQSWHTKQFMLRFVLRSDKKNCTVTERIALVTRKIATIGSDHRQYSSTSASEKCFTMIIPSMSLDEGVGRRFGLENILALYTKYVYR